MHKTDYIQAIISLLEDGKDFDDVIKKLKSVLEAKGHQKLYRAILEGLNKKLKSIHSNKARISVAQESHVKLLQEKINSALA